MYQTLWIDISSGKEGALFEVVLRKIREFKEAEGFPHAEVGLVFEEFDIFAIFDLEDNDLLLDFILREVAPLEGVEEIRMGQLCRVFPALAPLETPPLVEGITEDGALKLSPPHKGHSYFLIYLDALPIEYPRIFGTLQQMDDPNIRFFAYCLDSYAEDMVVCLAMEGFEEAKYHIVSKLRCIEGMRDSRTYMVNNVHFL
jgi:hypothetical protein